MIFIKKNVCFLIGSLSGTGGIGRVVSILSKTLSISKMYNIYVVGYSDNNVSIKCSYNFYKDVLLFGLDQENKSMKKGIFNASKKLREIINDNDIDVLISCGALYFPLGVLSTGFKKCKLICWEHSNYYVTTDHTYSKLSRKIGSIFADKLITLTKKDMNNYIDNEKIKSIEYIYNPIDPILVSRDIKYNVESKKIISVGRLSYQKNFEALIEVAHRVFINHNDWEWHIYGDGEDREILKCKIKEYDLDKKIILKGRVENIYDIYNEYSMLVMTSRYEGFPMTIIESLTSNIPVISFNIQTGPDELIEDGINGFLVNFEDIEEMVDKINQLIDNKELRLSMSNNCYRIREKLNIDMIIDKWDDVIKSL